MQRVYKIRRQADGMFFVGGSQWNSIGSILTKSLLVECRGAVMAKVEDANPDNFWGFTMVLMPGYEVIEYELVPQSVRTAEEVFGEQVARENAA